MTAPRLVSLLALAGGLALPGLAYESGPQESIPEHACPWIETKQPDIHTVFLWKFNTGQDRDEATGAMLEKGDLGAFLADEGEAGGGLVKPGGAIEPGLVGDSRLLPGGGRFGGGLALGGAGYAEGAAPLKALLSGDGGFTLEFWFRGPTNLVANLVDKARDKVDDKVRDKVNDKGEWELLSIPDFSGQPLLSVTWSGSTSVVFSVAGRERLRVPVLETVGGWHHLALVFAAPREQAEHATLSLTVDGGTALAGKPDPWTPIPWFKGVPDRIGNVVRVGGAPGQPGLCGAVDEVWLSKGVRYLYPWILGGQELDRKPADLELKPPFFKSNKLLTRFRFDGDLKPDAFAGLSWTGRTEAARFQPGVQGQALDLSRIGEAGFEVAGNAFLPERGGTIEFWFRPLDWHNFYVGDYAGQDVPYQWLMAFRAPGEADYQASKNVEIVKGRSWQIAHQRRADGTSAVPWVKIQPGAWTHVLVTLADNGSQTVYLNGRPQKFHQLGLVLRGLAISRWHDKTGGDVTKDARRWAFVPSPTLVDELSVYGWGMSPEEAWNAYARWLPDAAVRMKPLPVFKVEYDYYAHSWDMREKLQILLACLPVGDTKPASADCELCDEKGAVLLAAQKQPLDEAGNATFTLEQALPFGRYPVVVRSRDAAGAVLKEQKQEYIREQPAWFGNTLGKDRTVPKPWTPITLEGRTLRVIGREIELGANGLPAKIETLRQSVLAAPATVRVGGAELTGQGPAFTETAPDRVAWKAKLGGAGLNADLDAWMEFDGLVYCAITLRPAVGSEATVEDLDIDFPMHGAVATQLLANGGGRDMRNSWIAKYVPAVHGKGKSANENGDDNGSRLGIMPRSPLSSPSSSTDSASLVEVWNSIEQPYPSFCRAFEVSNFMPNIWIGNDDVGLYFGAENDQGWTVDGPKPAQEILRQGDRVVFRMNVIREPTRIEAAGRRFHFVLLPTPAKPEPPDWRRDMIEGLVSFAAVDTFSGFDLKTDPSDPAEGDCFRLEPRSWEHAAMAARGCRTKNRADGLCYLYADASWPGLGPAFRDWRHHMWADTGKIAWTPEFEDYAVWAINEFITRGLIDGVYWDDVTVGSTLLLRGGAYEYAGSSKGRRVGFTALAQRRVNMRLWRLFEAAKKEPCIWAHMTVCYEVPLFSFCRYLANCEFVTGVEFPGKRDAMDMWSPDTLRILGGSAKWGVGYHNLSTLPRTLPDSAAARQWSYPQKRTETALYLTSDQFGPPDGLGEVLAREKVFDGSVRAYPWWKAGEVMKVTAPTNAQALACVYALEGRAIVIVANRDRGGEHDVSLDLVVDRLFPGAKGVVWRDLDPGLKPPEAVAASAAELDKVRAGAGNASLTGGKDVADEAELQDFLEADAPEERALKRLKLRTDGSTAQVVIRPRDYRVLEARPRR
jgi:hypothetical protein